MKMTRKLVLFVVALCCFTDNSMALEASDAVKSVLLLKTTTTWDGQPIRYPQGKAEVTALRVDIAPGTDTGWHTHSAPSFAVMLEGELEVTLEDGRVKKLQAGDVLAEVVKTPHIGHNRGVIPVKLVVFYAGTKGGATTQKMLPGADRDLHACIGSAGYAWCQREKACVRPWELAKQKRFELNEKAFDRYCTERGE